MSYYTVFVLIAALSLCFAVYLLFLWITSKLDRSEEIDQHAYQQTLHKPDDQTGETPVDQDCLFAKMGVTDDKVRALFKGDWETLSPHSGNATKQDAAQRDHDDRMKALNGTAPPTSHWDFLFNDDDD